MDRIGHALRGGLVAVFFIQGALLTPLHERAELPAPRAAGDVVQAAYDSSTACPDPAHHQAGGAHDRQHCLTCTLAGRPALAADGMVYSVGFGVTATAVTAAAVTPRSALPLDEAPRGPPSNSLA
jgi:hypothetical protein